MHGMTPKPGPPAVLSTQPWPLQNPCQTPNLHVTRPKPLRQHPNDKSQLWFCAYRTQDTSACCLLLTASEWRMAVGSHCAPPCPHCILVPLKCSASLTSIKSHQVTLSTSLLHSQHLAQCNAQPYEHCCADSTGRGLHSSGTSFPPPNRGLGGHVLLL